MPNFLAQICIGLSLFIFGLQVFFKPRLHNLYYGFYWDFTDHNRFWGSVCMLVGVAFLSLSIWHRIKNKTKGHGRQGNKEAGADKHKGRDDRE